jgi:hypothetical protein
MHHRITRIGDRSGGEVMERMDREDTHLSLAGKASEELVGLELGLLFGDHPGHFEDKSRQLLEDSGRLEG